ncbi:hypothetical protein GGX14DRAFT_351042, partial [Mycena pura]
VSAAARSHTRRDRYCFLDVYTLGTDGAFLAADVPKARIATSDIPPRHPNPTTLREIVELWNAWAQSY